MGAWLGAAVLIKRMLVCELGVSVVCFQVRRLNNVLQASILSLSSYHLETKPSRVDPSMKFTERQYVICQVRITVDDSGL